MPGKLNRYVILYSGLHSSGNSLFMWRGRL